MPKTRIGNFLKGLGGAAKKMAEQLAEKVNKSKIIKTIRQALTRPTQKEFARLKAEMIGDFKKLKVVEAIEYGPGFGDNDFAGILGGKGDLFSFLGFKRSLKPINPLIALMKKMRLKRLEGDRLAWEVENFPTIENIEAATVDQLEWADGISWATGLENGIPGLGRYINAPFAAMGVTQSLSHYGLQKEHGPNRNTQPIKWITPFLDEWFKKFEESGYTIARSL